MNILNRIQKKKYHALACGLTLVTEFFILPTDALAAGNETFVSEPFGSSESKNSTEQSSKTTSDSQKTASNAESKVEKSDQQTNVPNEPVEQPQAAEQTTPL